MPTSFVVFLIIAIVLIAIAAFRMGARISKAANRDDPTQKNTIPYDVCLAKNADAFNYGTFIDSRDGETYRTVKIGKQIWMAENLRFNAEGSFAPNGNEENVQKYGRLYTWTSALDIPSSFADESLTTDLQMVNRIREKNYKGIAPEGWHIPSNKEWEELVAQLKFKGEDLRSACIRHKPGKDSLGFFALPAGYRFNNGAFWHFGDRARFWSKDEYCNKANAFRFSITEESMDIEGIYRSDALSVRCIKNT